MDGCTWCVTWNHNVSDEPNRQNATIKCRTLWQIDFLDLWWLDYSRVNHLVIDEIYRRSACRLQFRNVVLSCINRWTTGYYGGYSRHVRQARVILNSRHLHQWMPGGLHASNRGWPHGSGEN